MFYAEVIRAWFTVVADGSYIDRVTYTDNNDGVGSFVVVDTNGDKIKVTVEKVG